MDAYFFDESDMIVEAGTAETSEILIVMRADGGCYVFGGRRFCTDATSADARQRQDARMAAFRAVVCAGGVAWDDRGRVNLVVPQQSCPPEQAPEWEVRAVGGQAAVVTVRRGGRSASVSIPKGAWPVRAGRPALVVEEIPCP